jgi:Lon protease-like protein
MPGGIMKLRLFERRYIDMVTNCFRTQTGFGICLIKDGNEAGAPSLPYPLGTRVSIVDFDQGDDGLLHITTQGDVEFELLTYAPDDSQLLIGEVAELPAQAPVPMSPEIEELASKLDLILTYVEPEITFSQKRLDDPDWVCHRLLELLPLAPEAKYELLQLQNNRERLAALAAFKIEIGQAS